jgi:hypothetical protein
MTGIPYDASREHAAASADLLHWPSAAAAAAWPDLQQPEDLASCLPALGHWAAAFITPNKPIDNATSEILRIMRDLSLV